MLKRFRVSGLRFRFKDLEAGGAVFSTEAIAEGALQHPLRGGKRKGMRGGERKGMSRRIRKPRRKQQENGEEGKQQARQALVGLSGSVEEGKEDGEGVVRGKGRARVMRDGRRRKPTVFCGRACSGEKVRGGK